MERILYSGIILLLAGCSTAVYKDQAPELLSEGWHSPQKTDAALSQDLDYCNAKCASS